MMHRPFLIIVGGGSGSGKSTLVETLALRLGISDCLIVSLDNYYKDEPLSSLEEREALNFDHPSQIDLRLLTRHLDELLEGHPIEAPSYDFTSHTRKPETRRLLPRRYLIVEGILALHFEALVSLADLKVFVDTPADISFIRRLRRDVLERGRSVDSVIRQYLGTVRPMHSQYVAPSANSADLVVDGEEDPDGLSDCLAKRILAIESGTGKPNH